MARKSAANWTNFADAFVDLRSEPNLNGTTAPNNLTFYDPDKTHLKPAGYALEAAIAIIQLRYLLTL